VILHRAYASGRAGGSEHGALLGPRSNGAGQNHVAIVHRHTDVLRSSLRSSLKRIFDRWPDGRRRDRRRDDYDPIDNIFYAYTLLTASSASSRSNP
jgi:hypothetical protein